MALENNRLGLLKVIEASANIFERRNLAAFAEGVLQQLTALLYLNKDAMLVQPCGMLARPASNALNILAATGCYSDYEGTVEISAFDSDIGDRLGAAIAQRSSNYGDNYWVSYYITESGMEQLLYVSAKDVFSIPDIAMIELFVRNVAIAHETIALLESNNHD